MQMVMDIPPQLKRAGRDPYLAAIYLGPYLVDAAREAARTEAQNHRDFLVGCSAMAIRKGKLGLAAAGNFYPVKDGPKECAETPVLDAIGEHHFKRIPLIVVSAEVQPDTDGLELPHLPHCNGCTERMEASTLIGNKTVSMFVNAAKDEYGLYTFAEQLELKRSVHDTDAPKFFDHHADPGFKTWLAGADAYRNHVEGSPNPRTPFAGMGRGPELMKLAVTGALAAYQQ